ncbi:molecular chaperone DnaJ, partial [Myxococcus stipitatus]|uniref:DUF4388 domain-containing protein n=1 Tax=Myxococcus stipitatus TaxID=83455 RepID=UPI002DD42E9F
MPGAVARPGTVGAAPSAQGHAPVAGVAPAPGYPPGSGVPPAPGYPPVAGVAPAPGRPPGAPVAGVAPGAAPTQGRPPGAPVAGAAPASAPAVAGAPPTTADAAHDVPPQGQLDQTSPIQLYGRIAAAELTGLLTLTQTDRTTLIHFRKGNPEFVDSTHAEDALGTSLMGARLLMPDQLQQAEAARERFGGDLLATLFGLGLLQPATAFSVLGQRATTILFKGLRAETGAFTFEPRELPGNKAMPLGNRWAVLSDSVRRMPSADIRRRLTPVLQLPIMKSGGIVPASDLRLTPHEVRALTVIDGVRSIAQLLTDFPQDADHLLRLTFLLKELEAVSFAAVPQSGASARAAPPPEAAARPASAPSPTAARPVAPGATPAPGQGVAGTRPAAP